MSDLAALAVRNASEGSPVIVLDINGTVRDLDLRDDTLTADAPLAPNAFLRIDRTGKVT